MRRLLILGVLVIVAACTASSSRPSPPSTSTSEHRTVLNPSLAGCSPHAVRKTVHAFLRAYNSGASDLVERFIAKPGEFRWFAQPDRPYPGAQATDRANLAAYFQKRHNLGDHYELTALRISPDVDSFRNRGFAIQVRLSGSVPSPRPYGGKGSITCDTSRLAVWLLYG
jgi:hypothetical protein